MLVSSYHLWFGYPFAMLPMREWMHCNPWYTSKYCCNYRIEEWSSHTKRGFSPFPPPHTKTSGYYHHLHHTRRRVDIIITSTTHEDEWILSSPPPHTKTSGYYHHQKQFSNPDEHCHCQSDSYKFGAAYFNNNSACNDSCHPRQDTILHRANAKRWFHSPCHRNLRLSPSSFWFLSNFLCTCPYGSPSSNLFSTFDAYISL